MAVGLLAARWLNQSKTASRPIYWSMFVWSGLSLAPDLDILGFYVGVRYEDPWGHRGATHSITFAAAAGVLTFLCARAASGRLKEVSALRLALTSFLVIMSHGVLDTLTDGGLGCALLWPFSDQRFFAPWTPIPVAPLGARFLSLRGFFVALVELCLFAPLLLIAFLKSRRD